MKILKTLFYIFFPLVVGTLVGIATRPYIEYNTLNKPIFSPPSIVFPIVWSILYLLIGISYYLFKRKDDDFKTTYVYYLQLFVNYLWSFIYFVYSIFEEKQGICLPYNTLYDMATNCNISNNWNLYFKLKSQEIDFFNLSFN